MSGSLLDSKAVFLARLRSAGIPEADITLLVGANADTMAKMDLVCSVQPGVGDDVPLMAFFVQVRAHCRGACGRQTWSIALCRIGGHEYPWLNPHVNRIHV